MTQVGAEPKCHHFVRSPPLWPPGWGSCPQMRHRPTAPPHPINELLGSDSVKIFPAHCLRDSLDPRCTDSTPSTNRSHSVANGQFLFSRIISDRIELKLTRSFCSPAEFFRTRQINNHRPATSASSQTATTSGRDLRTKWKCLDVIANPVKSDPNASAIRCN